MPIWTCEACGCRSTQGGDCIECGRSLGSPRKAVLAAGVATVVLSLLWVGSGALLGVQASLFAAFYGGLVSGAVVHVSGGRGVLYQAIASSFTLAGVVCAQTVLVLILWEEIARANDLAWESPGFVETLHYLVNYDPLTIVFCVLGLFGGFWVWRQPDA